ncbi:MAG: ABC transporter substrate-binding protein [Chloroflexi bacterium]|nr:ABC transporter substrate-binding protein [Chloroflexota bacterium]
MRTNKWWLAVSSLTVLGLVLSAAGGCAPAGAPGAPKPGAATPAPKPAEQPKYGGVLTIINDGDPPSFDAHQESTYMTFHAVGPATSTVLQFDPLENTKVVADIAEKWEASADGLTYTFSLRQGAKFHDGSPVTAEDARFSLERVRKPPKGTISPRALNFEPVKTIEAVNPTTLKITLERAYPSLLPFLAQGWMAVYPKKVVEEKGDMKKDVVGTGPFKYKEYKRGVSHELVKFEDYFIKGRPYLDGVKFFIVKEAGTRLSALRTKQGLAILPHPGIIPPEMEVLTKEEPGIAISSGLYPLFDGLIVNTRRKPWDDARVRRALLLGTDRQAAVQFLRQGSGRVGGPMPPSGQWDIPQEELLKMPGFRQPKDADIAEAKRLLAEAGVAPGTKASILARDIYKQEGVFQQDTLAKLGFDAVIDIQETATAFDRLRKADHEMTAWGFGVALDDPDAFFSEMYISRAARNYAGLKEPKVDDLFEKQSRTLDPVARKKIVIDMQKAYLENPGVIQTLWRVMNMALWKEVRSYKFPSQTFNNTKFQDVWLAK